MNTSVKVRARAPLRLSFGGGGTELSPYVEKYGGQVLNATIDIYAYAFLEYSNNNNIEINGIDIQEHIHVPLTPRLDTNLMAPLRIHCAVYNAIVNTFNNNDPLPVKLTTYCEAPIGSGLGASSTLTIAIVKAFDDLLGLALGKNDIAKLALQIERHDLGLKGGKQDQYAASFGGFNFFRFYGVDNVEVNPLGIAESTLRELEVSTLLYYTGISRESGNIIDDQTENVVNSVSDTIEHFHKIKKYALDLKEHLLLGQYYEFSKLIHESWQSKKATSNRISNKLVDQIYDLALENGAYGGKLSGAGGGGFMMLFCNPLAVHNIKKALESKDRFFVPFHFTNDGVISWKV